MATVNRVAKIVTHEGAPAKRIDAVAQLERSVMSCLLWEDEFYESGQTIGQRIAAIVKEIPAAEVARVAIQAKVVLLHEVPMLTGCFLAACLMSPGAPDDEIEKSVLEWAGIGGECD